MANTTNSTYMSLPIPIVGQDAGPQYATDLNSCLTLVDAHTHAPGSGTQITPAGLNINTDLAFGSNSATGLKKATFTSQSGALTGTSFLSFVSGNLYVNDGSGNQIPITSGGGVAGSPGSIGSLAAPASATYTAGSKLFTWLADSSKSAAMDNGAITIRETNVASAKGVTLQSATSLAADYSLTLPAALPASNQYLTSSNTGALSFSSANTIAAAMTTTGATAIQNVSTSNFAVGSTISFVGNANSDSTITNATASLTTYPNKIYKIQLIPDMVVAASFLNINNSGSTVFSLLINGVISAELQVSVPGSATSVTLPCSSICFYDYSLSGASTSVTYAIGYRNNLIATTLTISNTKLIVVQQ
jgi:hypothetical protein